MQRIAFLTGLASLGLIWSLAARNSLPAILPGPLAVAAALWTLLTEPSFWTDTLLPSLGRQQRGSHQRSPSELHLDWQAGAGP